MIDNEEETEKGGSLSRVGARELVFCWASAAGATTKRSPLNSSSSSSSNGSSSAIQLRLPLVKVVPRAGGREKKQKGMTRKKSSAALCPPLAHHIQAEGAQRAI